MAATGPAYPSVPPPLNFRRGFAIVGAVLAFTGGMILGAGQLWLVGFPPQASGTLRLILGLQYSGVLIGFGGSLLAAFMAPKDETGQKVGLLFLAAVFIFLLTQIRIPYYTLP